jgi:hypothetical protein
VNRPTGLRAGAGVIAANQAVVGAWASVAPRSFYEDFPSGWGWVAMLPPYNVHLVRDVGGLSLGFTVLFTLVMWRPASQLVRAVSVAWLVVAVPHLAFHLTHLRGLGAVGAWRSPPVSSWSSFCPRARCGRSRLGATAATATSRADPTA